MAYSSRTLCKLSGTDAEKSRPSICPLLQASLDTLVLRLRHRPFCEAKCLDVESNFPTNLEDLRRRGTSRL